MHRTLSILEKYAEEVDHHVLLAASTVPDEKS